jgi:hypothetical protein
MRKSVMIVLALVFALSFESSVFSQRNKPPHGNDGGKGVVHARAMKRHGPDNGNGPIHKGRRHHRRGAKKAANKHT